MPIESAGKEVGEDVTKAPREGNAKKGRPLSVDPPEEPVNRLVGPGAQRNERGATNRKDLVPARAGHLEGPGILRPSEILAMTREEEAPQVEGKPVQTCNLLRNSLTSTKV